MTTAHNLKAIIRSYGEGMRDWAPDSQEELDVLEALEARALAEIDGVIDTICAYFPEDSAKKNRANSNSSRGCMYGQKHPLITRMQMVSDLLVKYDPEGLIALGCPSDEYECEAVMIVRKLAGECPPGSDPTADDILNFYVDICKGVFEAAFCRPHTEFDWRPVAKEVIEIYG